MKSKDGMDLKKSGVAKRSDDDLVVLEPPYSDTILWKTPLKDEPLNEGVAMENERWR